MNNPLQIDPQDIALVSAVDPLDDPRVEADAGLDTDAALTAILAQAGSDGRRHSTAHRPRRRALQVGAVTAVAAAAAVVAVNVASTGDDGVSSTLQGSGIGVSSARAETLVARARHAIAMAPAAGEVQKVVATSRKDGGPISRSTTWTELEAPYNSRTVYETAGGPAGESGQTNGHDEFFDAATDTVYREVDAFPEQEAGGSPALVGAVEFLRRPGLKVDREATLEGTPAIEASREEPDGSVSSYWFSKDTYEPLRFTNTGPGGDGGFVESYEAVETLGGEAAAGGVDSVAAQHASASVIELPNARYVAKEVQFMGE